MLAIRKYIYGGLYYVWLAMLVRMFIGMFVRVFLLVQSLYPYNLAIPCLR
jgi:hypothetical protein